MRKDVTQQSEVTEQRVVISSMQMPQISLRTVPERFRIINIKLIKHLHKYEM